MRTISAQEITDTVARLCIEANTRLPQDVQAALDKARQEEPWPLAKSTLDLLWSNLSAAKEENLPICQDTGMACVFVELGPDVHIDGSFEAAIHEGVRRGYTDGYLRKSIVADPLRRGNTGDNTPAAITVHLVDGEGCRITVAPKGFGSENMSQIKMLKPSDGLQGVKEATVIFGHVVLHVAAISGLGNARAFIDDLIKNDSFEDYSFIEVMACRRGCIMGGGQPVDAHSAGGEARAKGLYAADVNTQIKKSNENPLVQSLYDGLLKGKEHKLLHRNFNKPSQ